VTYLSSTELAKRCDTTGIAADDIAAILTDIDSCINVALGITTNTTDAMTLAAIIPIANRMARMEFQYRRIEKMVDQVSAMSMAAQACAPLGISQPIMLTRQERAMLMDAWSSASANETAARRGVSSVYNTRTGRRIY
jgi:hypothetical protein